MKKTLFIIATIVLAVIAYFIGKSKGWWNLFSSSTSPSNNKSSNSNTLTKISNKIRGIDTTINEYGVDTATVQINWEGKDVYKLKDSKRPTGQFAFGYLYDGTIVFQYQENGIWIFSTEPYQPTQNQYGVDTRTILDYYNGIPIYQFRNGVRPDGVIGYLEDGTYVYESWINEGTPDEKKVYYW
ncbi:hypothetical protein QM480_18435 [Flectobacillus sp. DC10W]|uniref:DUF5590 domain-containing protein n=1 Tax=Flectobacillus longus TaxID=2984207 RepID=A0ABT6YRX0_9BACT|nr:hypothetical protein [Flectobacillus longus]MDI9866324.1 hypothetical protein [Flectobacillus longus]